MLTPPLHVLHVFDIGLRIIWEKIFVGKSQWGFTVSAGGLLRFQRCGGIRLLPLSPVASQFQHFFATGQGSRAASPRAGIWEGNLHNYGHYPWGKKEKTWTLLVFGWGFAENTPFSLFLLCVILWILRSSLARLYFTGHNLEIALFSEQPVSSQMSPLPLPFPCMFVKWAKSRPELGPLRTGTSGIPRLAHHPPIFFLRPPACTLLHSPHQCKTQPTPTGLEDTYFPGKRHKWRVSGHCKVAHSPSCIKTIISATALKCKHMISSQNI